MKLVICGKGGSGKSTITALLARHYAHTGKNVLVVDTDESNASLHRLLGTGQPKDLLEYFGGKKTMMESFRKARENRDPSEAPKNECSWTIGTIPHEYVATSQKGIHLVAIGKIHEAGEGCACPMGVLAKQFLSGLQLTENDRVIIDTEAGIEHFGRGIDKVCDKILMVIDPSFESVSLAEKVAGMAGKIDIPLYYVLNKTDESSSRQVRTAISEKDRIVGEFRQDPVLLAAGLAGKELPDDYPAIPPVLEKIE